NWVHWLLLDGVVSRIEQCRTGGARVLSIPHERLRLERDAWSMVTRLRQATNEYAPPHERLRTRSIVPRPHAQSASRCCGQLSFMPTIIQTSTDAWAISPEAISIARCSTYRSDQNASQQELSTKVSLFYTCMNSGELLLTGFRGVAVLIIIFLVMCMIRNNRTGIGK
ncbi:unnamed protein product, partial [Sphacelaria rigidula]